MKLRQEKYHYREPRYIIEVNKIYEHFSNSVIEVCREAAQFAINNAKYELLEAQVRVAQTEIAYEFNHRVHTMLERGASAEEVIAIYGDFNAFQTEYLATTGKYKWSQEVCALVEKNNYWWVNDDE
jgi:tRNA A37 N6-isopentenylltransferase MiaA